MRFFRETVFREAGEALADGLEELVAKLAQWGVDR